MKTKTAILSIALVTGLMACGEKPTNGNTFDETYIELGQSIVAERCAFCHTAGPSGDRPRTDAPPLRIVLATYNTSALADDFREHLHVGHPDMPDFNFTVKQTEGLLAYLSSIQVVEDADQ